VPKHKYPQSSKNAWIHAVEPWLAAEGEQLAFPGLPEPPEDQLARLLPFVLVFYADPSGGSIRPSYARIARVSGTSLKTVRRAFKANEDRGLIKRHGPAYRGHAQQWTMAAPAWLLALKGVTGDPLSLLQHDSPQVSKGGHTEPERGSPVTPHHSPKGDGPISAASDAPLGARVATAEELSPLDVTCPSCGRTESFDCKNLSDGPKRGDDGFHATRRFAARGLREVS